MICTEEEAKSKFCPMSIERRESMVIKGAGCLGSKCMAWKETIAMNKESGYCAFTRPMEDLQYILDHGELGRMLREWLRQSK